MATKIHPTAVIAPSAELGRDVQIGPYAVIGGDVTIGDDTRIGPQVVIDGATTIGARNVIVGQTSLGAAPQDFSYRGEKTQLQIGDDNLIREFVTINRGTVKGGGVTRIGSKCLLMACCHVAHDCELQDGVILANNVLLAGHVLVERGANISGSAAAHHFVTIGEYCYVGGLTRINQDVPPYMILEGHPSRVRGVNVVGLARNGVHEDEIESLRVAFRRIYRSGAPRSQTLDALRSDAALGDHVRNLILHLEQTEAGVKGRHREILRDEFARLGEERLAAWEARA